MSTTVTFKTITEYNNHLVTKKILKNFTDYMLDLNRMFWKTENSVDEKTILLLLGYTKRTDFCISQDMLFEFEVLNDDTNIKECLTEFFLTENKDYRIREGKFQLTPRAFKKCLMIGQDKYADYFINVGDALMHYASYQTILSNKCLIELLNR